MHIIVSAENKAGAAQGTLSLTFAESASVIPVPGSFRIADLANDAPEIIAEPAAGSFTVGLKPQDTTPPSPGPEGEPAAPADSFVDCIGINTHLNWGEPWSSTAWRQLLLDLKVHFHRTMVGRLNSAKAHIDWLHAYGGMKTVALCAVNRAADGAAIYPSYDVNEVSSYIEFLRKEIGADKLAAIEGPNEDNRPDKTAGWEKRIRDVQRHVWNSVRQSSDPAFSRLPVIAPSIYRRDENDTLALGDISGTADGSSLHYYTSGFKPTQGNIRRNDSTVQTTMDAVIAQASRTVPTGSVWVTEYGHPVRTISGYDYGLEYISPLAQAKYGLRGIAEFFRRGIRHINWYCLFDDYPAKGNYNHFGLIEHSTDNSLKPRPSYFALQRLIALMSDPGAAFTTGSLEFTITGADLNDVRHLLFQKRDGRFLMMIWLDASSYDRMTFKDLVVTPRAITLAFPRMVRSVRCFQPTLNGTTSVLAQNANSVSLSVPDHLMIVEIIE